MFARVKTVKAHSYLQIVENRREGAKVKQRVIATLGHAEEFIDSGKLDSLTRSLLKHTRAVRVVDAHREGSIQAHGTRSIGPSLVFSRLWEELGIPEAINTVSAEKRFTFSLEKAIFLTVLHRLFASGSDRAAERWKRDYAIDGAEDTIEKLEAEDLDISYILGVRMRRNTLPFLDGVDMNGTDVVTVTQARQSSKDHSPLKVTERVVDDKRYIICYNEEQARKDKRDREAILASLREKVNHSDKNLVGNKGFRKYLKTTGPEHFTIDEENITSEAMYDGLWVLTSNLPSGAPEIARMYKELWMVEQVFRSIKSVLETRPIYHKRDDTIRGHVFCSFLALKLLKELEIRLAARGLRYEWEEIKQDLKALQEVELEFEGTTWHLRTDVRGCCADVLRSVGVAIPSSIRR